MNGSMPATTKFFSACRALWLVTFTAMLFVSFALAAGRAAAADDPQPDVPLPKLKPPTAKSGSAQSTAKPAAKPVVPAGKPSASQSPSIAGDLLDERSPSDLDDQLLDGLPPTTKPPAKQPPAKRPSAKPPVDRPPTEGPVLGGSGADPLFRIGGQMLAVERRLEAQQPDDADTPKLQDEIVEQLAQLIERLEQQQNSQQASASSKTPQTGSATERKQVRQPGPPGTTAGAADNRPAKESTERLGKNEARAATPEEMRGLMKDVWGQLPAREREQMLQSPPEQFLPKYELLLEKYYKRLADQQQHRP
jgi:hypothetical protein